MPVYNYKVKDNTGRVQKGKVEAVSMERAADTLRERQLFIVSLTPDNGGGLFGKKDGGGSKMKFNDAVIFTRQLAAIVEAGLTLTTGISILLQQSKPAVRNVLSQLLSDLESGMSFSQALKKHPKTFDKSYVYLVQAGESSGSLDVVLNRLADHMEEQREFRGKVGGALIYPAAILIVMVVVIIVMMTMVLPKLLSIFDEFNAELPLPTKILMWVSNAFTTYWWVLLLATIAAVVVFMIWYRGIEAKRIVDRLIFKVPIYGDLRTKLILTNYTQTLAMLISSGVSMVDSLSLARESVTSIIFQDNLDVVGKQVERGISFGLALEPYKEFPMIMPQMIKVGEETGKIDEIMVNLSRYFSGEASRAVDGLMAAFEPIIMVLLGLVVAFLVVAIILPIYDLTNQVSV